ncbi:YggS family pyridoxal phosphate-dependent enzyme, partial [Francisella tularensis subsp. holarctica]|nr:YggS family pyridoxal phosphate-dependent enzyme [Francisella tularensis subsp. holarctica]
IFKIVDVFLVIIIDEDINNSGFESTQLEVVVASIIKAKSFMNLKIVGLICIPAKTNAPEMTFAKMKNFFDTVNFILNYDL